MKNKQFGFEWDIETVKALSIEDFKDKIEHFIKIGKIEKATDIQIKKAYYEITGFKEPIIVKSKNK